VTFYALKNRDSHRWLASNPDPAFGQPYAETDDEAEAVAWSAMSLTVMNMTFLPEPDAWEIEVITRFAPVDVEPVAHEIEGAA
jgi:hypothetical protein